VRLEVLEHGHGRRQRIALRVAKLFLGVEDDVVKASFYRPEFFGGPWLRMAHSVMRGPSEWTPGDRELFGAFISRLNACRYCAGIHSHAATLAGDSAVDRIEPIGRWREAGLPPRIQATLELLEKMTERPDDLGRSDIDAVRAAGVSDNAIADVLYVGFLFNLINRLANAFGFEWGDEATAAKIAAVLNRVSYKVPDFLLR
jgi:uncharacterized peroxidase-related enzyme